MKEHKRLAHTTLQQDMGKISMGLLIYLLRFILSYAATAPPATETDC